jgi:hypothetical protein
MAKRVNQGFFDDEISDNEYLKNVPMEKHITFSKEILKDIEVIAKYRGMKASAFTKVLENVLVPAIQKRRDFIVAEAEGQWVMGKISDTQLHKFTGKVVPQSLKDRKKAYIHNSVAYKGFAKKALVVDSIS